MATASRSGAGDDRDQRREKANVTKAPEACQQAVSPFSRVIEYGTKLGRSSQEKLPVGEQGDMEFCLESCLPLGGIAFERQLVLEDGDRCCKSFGYRRSQARLVFRTDGIVVGQFLSVVVFSESEDADEDGSATGHHSGWQACYRVYPAGKIRFYRCTDACDEVLEQLPDFHDGIRREGVERDGLEPMIISEGSELDRIRAAQGMTVSWGTQNNMNRTVFHARHPNRHRLSEATKSKILGACAKRWWIAAYRQPEQFWQNAVSAFAEQGDEQRQGLGSLDHMRPPPPGTAAAAADAAGPSQTNSPGVVEAFGGDWAAAGAWESWWRVASRRPDSFWQCAVLAMPPPADLPQPAMAASSWMTMYEYGTAAWDERVARDAAAAFAVLSADLANQCSCCAGSMEYTGTGPQWAVGGCCGCNSVSSSWTLDADRRWKLTVCGQDDSAPVCNDCFLEWHGAVKCPASNSFHCHECDVGGVVKDSTGNSCFDCGGKRGVQCGSCGKSDEWGSEHKYSDGVRCDHCSNVECELKQKRIGASKDTQKSCASGSCQAGNRCSRCSSGDLQCDTCGVSFCPFCIDSHGFGEFFEYCEFQERTFISRFAVECDHNTNPRCSDCWAETEGEIDRILGDGTEDRLSGYDYHRICSEKCARQALTEIEQEEIAKQTETDRRKTILDSSGTRAKKPKTGPYDYGSRVVTKVMTAADRAAEARRGAVDLADVPVHTAAATGAAAVADFPSWAEPLLTEADSIPGLSEMMPSRSGVRANLIEITALSKEEAEIGQDSMGQALASAEGDDKKKFQFLVNKARLPCETLPYPRPLIIYLAR